MEAIRIYGGNCLEGQTTIQGSKNAVLPVLAATLLIDGICVIDNCPVITDVYHMLRLMESAGCTIKRIGHRVEIDTGGVTPGTMPADSVGVMRSSITLLGALLARCKKARMDYPGGCVIGQRPIDLHLAGLRRMGVVIREEPDGFEAEAERMHGAVHKLPFVSVGATENLILAAVLAEGETVIEPAAREPEIQTLCHFLRKAGAKIRGIGTSRLRIQGVERLRPVAYVIPADRIVAGTYVAACMCAGGRVFLRDAPVSQMQAVLDMAVLMGAETEVYGEGLTVIVRRRPKAVPVLRTGCYPRFPTDLQSPFLCVMALADGVSIVEENVFENRFRIVEELNRMGADVTVQANQALVRGRRKLSGTRVEAKELRGGAALVAAGAAAEGITVIGQKHFLDRGYERIVEDMNNLGVCAETCEEARE